MTYEELKTCVDQYVEDGLRLFTTCSFQTHSLVLLHMLSRIKPDIPVVFINTGFHFPQTITFRDRVLESFGMTSLVDVRSETPKSLQRDRHARFLFTSDPDYCCYLNKTLPLESVLRTHDVWISGVRAEQSEVRQRLKTEQPAAHGTVRLHPMLDWTSKQIHAYRTQYALPSHPLEALGYLSVGCEPCTRRFDPDMTERDARWFGLNKIECGLNTDLVETK